MEIMMVVVISILVLDMKQALELVKGFRKFMSKIISFKDQVNNEIINITTDINESISEDDFSIPSSKKKYILGDDGEMYEAYEISDDKTK